MPSLKNGLTGLLHGPIHNKLIWCFVAVNGLSCNQTLQYILSLADYPNNIYLPLRGLNPSVPSPVSLAFCLWVTMESSLIL